MDAVISESVIRGAVMAPPSKSMGHRYLLCAALADGVSHISNVDFSHDIDATLECANALGAKARRQPTAVEITGNCGFIPDPKHPVFCNESGSTLRFCLPLFSLCGNPVRFTGAGRLMQRPQSVYQQIFHDQNLTFDQDDNGIQIAGRLRAGSYVLPGDISSQFISGLLFTLPMLRQDSTIHILPPVESRSYIQLTLAALEQFGIRAGWAEGNTDTLVVPGSQKYRACDVTVSGDWSNAAFFAVLGAICGGIRLKGLNPQSAQGDRAILEILRRCGARIRRDGNDYLFEKTALIAPVTPIDVADCPDLGPILMVLAAYCKGRTTMIHTGRLRIKESDRITSMQKALTKMGVYVDTSADTAIIQCDHLHAPQSAISGQNDHRIVMCMTIALLGGGFKGTITDAEAVAKSWPGFFDAVRQVGGKVELKNA